MKTIVIEYREFTAHTSWDKASLLRWAAQGTPRRTAAGTLAVAGDKTGSTQRVFAIRAVDPETGERQFSRRVPVRNRIKAMGDVETAVAGWKIGASIQWLEVTAEQWNQKEARI